MPPVKNFATSLAEGLTQAGNNMIAAREKAKQDELDRQQKEAQTALTNEQVRKSKEESDLAEKNRKIQYLTAVKAGAEKALASGTLDASQVEYLKNWNKDVNKVIQQATGLNPDTSALDNYQALEDALVGLGDITIEGLAEQGGWNARQQQAAVKQAEGQAKLTDLQAKQVEDTYKTTVEKINAENNAATAKSAVIKDLINLDRGAARAEYLSRIAGSGEIGAAIAKELMDEGVLDAETLKAVEAKSGRVVRAEEAAATQAETNLALTGIQLNQAKQTFDSTVKVINSTNDLKVIQNAIESDLADLKGVGQRAAYLKAIADTGEVAKGAIEQLRKDGKIGDAEYQGMNKAADLVTQAQEYQVAGMGLANETTYFNLKQILPAQQQSIILANKGKEIDVDRAKFDLEQAKDLAPYIKDKAVAELDLLQAQRDLAKATLKTSIDEKQLGFMTDILNKYGSDGLSTLEDLGYVTDENRDAFENYAMKVDEAKTADALYKDGVARDAQSKARVSEGTEQFAIDSASYEAGTRKAQQKLTELQAVDFEAKMPATMKALELSNALTEQQIDLAKVNVGQIRKQIEAMDLEIQQKGQQFPEQLAYLKAQRRVLEAQAEIAEATQAGEIDVKNLSYLVEQAKIDPTIVDRTEGLTDKQKNLIRNYAVAFRDSVMAEGQIKGEQVKQAKAQTTVVQETAKQAVITTKFANKEAQTRIDLLNEQIASSKADAAYKLKQMELAYDELDEKKLMNAAEREYMKAQIANMQAQVAIQKAKAAQESGDATSLKESREGLTRTQIGVKAKIDNTLRQLNSESNRYLGNQKWDKNNFSQEITSLIPNWDQVPPEEQKKILALREELLKANSQLDVVNNALAAVATGQAIDLKTYNAAFGIEEPKAGSGTGGTIPSVPAKFPKGVNQAIFNKQVLDALKQPKEKGKPVLLRLENKLVAAKMSREEAKSYIMSIGGMK